MAKRHQRKKMKEPQYYTDSDSIDVVPPKPPTPITSNVMPIPSPTTERQAVAQDWSQGPMLGAFASYLWSFFGY